MYILFCASETCGGPELPAAVSCTAAAAEIEDVVSPSGLMVRVAPAVGIWPSRFFRCTASAALLI